MDINRIRELAGLPNTDQSAKKMKLTESAPPGMEKTVMQLKKEYPGDEAKAFAKIERLGIRPAGEIAMAELEFETFASIPMAGRTLINRIALREEVLASPHLAMLIDEASRGNWAPRRLPNAS